MTIACIISFIVGALAMFCAIGLMSCLKDKKPRNKVRFFIRKIKGVLYLNIRNQEHSYLLCGNINFREWDLNPANFTDMKDGEIREVFINLED